MTHEELQSILESQMKPGDVLVIQYEGHVYRIVKEEYEVLQEDKNAWVTCTRYSINNVTKPSLVGRIEFNEYKPGWMFIEVPGFLGGSILSYVFAIGFIKVIEHWKKPLQSTPVTDPGAGFTNSGPTDGYSGFRG